MTKTAKKKARKKTKSQPGRQRPPKEKPFDAFAPGPEQVLKPGDKMAVPRLPSLMEAVRDRLRYWRRKDFLPELCKLYTCSAATVDRAIAEVRKEWEEYVSQDRAKRIAHKTGIYMRLASKAEELGDIRTSIAAVKRLDILLGDEAPKKLIVDTPMDGKSPELLQEEANRLFKLSQAKGA